MDIKKNIPNAITCLNLLTGCIAITIAFKGNLVAASLLVFLAGIFDFVDGFSARLLKAYSPVGKQLDSLADVVSFGVLPAVIMFKLLERSSGDFYPGTLMYFPFMIAIFSAIRLARFNVDERQTDSFIGLPTPAMAMLVASLPLILNDLEWTGGMLGNHYFLIAAIIVLSWLMVSNIPLFSLKIKSLKWSANKYPYILLISSAILLVFLKFAAIPIIIFLYILLSLIKKQVK